MMVTHRFECVQNVKDRSTPWDDGYSSEEINAPYHGPNVRIDRLRFDEATLGKTVIFVPNRVGGLGRSSDYTNCGHFLFRVVNELWKARQDFVVIAGNPSQKILNREIEEICPPGAFYNVLPAAPNRDEYKWLIDRTDIAVGLYNQDSYGGTAAREILDRGGAFPLWVDNYEYAEIARNVGWPSNMMIRPDLSDAVEITSRVIDFAKGKNVDGLDNNALALRERFRKEVRRRCSYEATTPKALERMGIIS
jgi:hypothetical protein